MYDFEDSRLNSKKTIIVGMSGGVDSSVTALILKQMGHEVIGVFMKNWEEVDENGKCHAEEDYKDVEKVCEKIGIPYYSIDFVKEYRDNVFQHFLDEYEAGHTPNPDILCNREIKFKVFFERAKMLGADFLATGHYIQTKEVNGKYSLLKGIDQNKDQSYFLYTLKEEVLKECLFPLGHLPKSKVRKIALEYDLATAKKKDSTGICFIGERNFKNFLSNYLQTKTGEFQTLDGKVVGKHTGSVFYTLGQRKGLGLGGPGEPWFVVGKNLKENIVYVERGTNHPALYTDGLTATDIEWVNKMEIKTPFKCFAKARYRQKERACTITKIEDDRMTVIFDRPERAITPRQSIVFYQDEVCLGGAMIESPFENYHELGKNLEDV